MITLSAELVKELRDRTGAGMMDCKATLKDSGGDMEKAIDFLRKKGVAQASKRAGRDAKEGLVIVKTQGSKAVLLEANCETDFVARTDDFKNLALMALEEVLAKGEGAIASEKITQKIAELSGKIGEKILVKRAKLLETSSGAFFTYTHSNNKLSVVVELGIQSQDQAVQELGKNIAMQVAASNPIALDRSKVSADLVEREKAIYREEVKGKPENIVEKIIQGKLDKFYQSQCLLEQPFIKDDKMPVKELLNQASKKIGKPVEIKSFTRFQLGENIG